MPYEKSVVVPLPPDETFALITEPERLRRWNNIAARIDLRAGGEFRWNIVPGAYAAGTVKELEPGRRIVFGWGWDGHPAPGDVSTVTVTLEPTLGGTLVHLVHEGLPEDQAAGHAEGWDHYLDRLVVAAASGDAGPDNWHASLAELTEQTAAEATLGIVERILRPLGPDQLGNSTPCEKFTVAGVAEHLSGSIVAIGNAAGAGLEPATSSSAGGLEAGIADLAQPALEAWAHRGLDGTVDVGAGEMPAPYALGILAVEFLVHAWDFASATGQKVEVDDDLATYVLGLSKRVVTEQLRVPQMFAPALEPAPDASPLEQLINWTGRAYVT